MRHNKKLNHLSRTSAHRKAMLANMASSLIIHKRISTTLAKAKALRIYVEPLITRSKLDTTHNRRVVFSYLQDKHAVAELFREVAMKVADRKGGYTRILKTGARSSDSAEMCIIELVDYNLNLLEAKESEGKKTRRSRRGRGKGSSGEKSPETKSNKQLEVADQTDDSSLDKVEPQDEAEVKNDPEKEKAEATEEKVVAEEKREEPIEEKKDTKKDENGSDEELQNKE